MTAHPDIESRTASCARCGRAKADDSPLEALAWVAEPRGDRTVWLCSGCARQHVRDIEGKLPTEFWA